MEYEIVELADFSGKGAVVYSIVRPGESKDLFTLFLEMWLTVHRKEVLNIVQRIRFIGQRDGTRDIYFKPNEGAPGDGVCALFDVPQTRLRVFCIRIGEFLILGGGGPKPKNIRAWQENDLLTEAAEEMKRYAADIHRRLKKGNDLFLSSDKMELEGDLKNYGHGEE